MPIRILVVAVFLFMLATKANCQKTGRQLNDTPKKLDASNFGESPQDKATTRLKDTNVTKEEASYREKQYCNGYSMRHV